ncbi:FAD-binding oxidoreductase [Roseomonas xinghualingensis]|uniref:FAD-binding oxidoreductase n=1 Tax=Roseomonas xinghualingensis TaxID=2986475 RepID=UPI0021F20926|nr:FAD-binding oxidoreductase [Roseomonas sp. SXEYE001]MCV4209825.1 FAD-binding oxidoreductase [Roseomonas sp. SXEYE001]
MTRRVPLSWGRAHRAIHRVVRPAFPVDASAALASAGPLLPYGMGRSYGDSCLNPGGTLIETQGLDRWIRFDQEAGIIEVEAGVTLADILARLHASALPARHWFLPVTPGTKFVTVGGAIANDVHGKNHHSAGCFGSHLLSLRLLRSDGTVRICSPDENPDLFAATIGGIGLTGLILSAVLQLKPVPSLWMEVEDIRYHSLDAFYALSAESADWEYTVAWVDCLASGTDLGRGIFTRARHAATDRAPPPPRLETDLSIPIDAPCFMLNGWTVGAFNALYWHRAPAMPKRRIGSYEPVFYPLDAIRGWNRLYGKAGFYQYQCVVPQGNAGAAVPALLRAVAAGRDASFLAVLKKLGNRPSPGMLSFPMPGVTLALDLPNRGVRTHELLNLLDQITAEAGGRIYPAKDGRVSARDFQRGFPAWRDFARHMDPHFSSSFWRRVSAPVIEDRTGC